MKPGDFVMPMLAETAPEPFSDPSWWFEVKWDGYRTILSIDYDMHVYSRTGKDLLTRYPELQVLDQYIPRHVVLDAELVAWQDGKPSFQALGRKGPKTLSVMVFDLLCVKGRWLLHEPLSERLHILSQVVESRGPLAVSEGIRGEGEEYFAAVNHAQLEGIMAKHLQSLYFPGKRSEKWKKCVVEHKAWFWVIGWHRAASGAWYWTVAEADEGGAVHGGPIAKVQSPAHWQPSSQHDAPFAVELSYRSRTESRHLRHPRVRQWRPSHGN